MWSSIDWLQGSSMLYHVWTHHTFWLPDSIPSYGHLIFLFIGWRASGLFPLLAVMNNAALNIYIHDFTFRYMYSFSIPRNGTFGHMATLCLTFEDCQTVFQLTAQFHIPTILDMLFEFKRHTVKKKKFSYPLFPALLDIMFTGMSYYLKFLKGNRIWAGEILVDSSSYLKGRSHEVQAFCSMLLLLWDQCHKILGAQCIFLNEWIFSVTSVLMRKMMLRKVRWLPKELNLTGGTMAGILVSISSPDLTITIILNSQFLLRLVVHGWPGTAFFWQFWLWRFIDA